MAGALTVVSLFAPFDSSGVALASTPSYLAQRLILGSALLFSGVLLLSRWRIYGAAFSIPVAVSSGSNTFEELLTFGLSGRTGTGFWLSILAALPDLILLGVAVGFVLSKADEIGGRESRSLVIAMVGGLGGILMLVGYVMNWQKATFITAGGTLSESCCSGLEISLENIKTLTYAFAMVVFPIAASFTRAKVGAALTFGWLFGVLPEMAIGGIDMIGKQRPQDWLEGWVGGLGETTVDAEPGFFLFAVAFALVGGIALRRITRLLTSVLASAGLAALISVALLLVPKTQLASAKPPDLKEKTGAILVVVAPKRLTIVDVDLKASRSIRLTSDIDSLPFVVDDSVVYIAGGVAYSLALRSSDMPKEIGEASTALSSTAQGRIWLWRYGRSGSFVRETDLLGGTTSPEVSLPEDRIPMRALPDGLLLIDVEPTGEDISSIERDFLHGEPADPVFLPSALALIELNLEVWDPATRKNVRFLNIPGILTSWGVNRGAWVDSECADDEPCRLHFVSHDAKDTVVNGKERWRPRGILEPNDGTLAIETSEFDPQTGNDTSHVELVKTKGKPTIIPDSSQFEAQSVAWSRDGKWLFFLGCNEESFKSLCIGVYKRNSNHMENLQVDVTQAEDVFFLVAG